MDHSRKRTYSGDSSSSPSHSDHGYIHLSHLKKEQIEYENNAFTTEQHRILTADYPRLKYEPLGGKVKRNTLHWGQRKLLLSEIEFLTLFATNNQWFETLLHKDSSTVQETSEQETIFLYAGAAPGKHLNLLSDMFPTIKFVLVDPNPFVCKTTDRIEIRQEYFTDEMAKEFSNRNVLFCSDIRTADFRKMSQEENEKQIELDNLAQKKWIEIMKPRASMLKFRLSYKPGITNYFDGIIFLPIWGRQSTTETRLVVPQHFSFKDYDNTVYEEQLFYFNNRARVKAYRHNIINTNLCYCYDCRSEVQVIEKYSELQNVELSSLGLKTKKEDSVRLVSEFVDLISKECAATGKRTLTDLFDTRHFKFHEMGHLSYEEQVDLEKQQQRREMVNKKAKRF